ncbi:hypothetical protein B0H67DRAFT_648418 [Lasiosphaeris hirsuta]|uniref:Uncharacterized protein n=1 Tax=Lasiosphaeris hirsuta TaxID=260670 RepID=A0AA40A2Z5_9PEZI|nr:hypothetical protein B0H67DRAFT_648418 [Lasiosphaeris hirsuta]
MAIEGATQGLVAAFTFGIVVNAASAALFLYTKGHGSAIFRDSQRLVLILFLLSAALWAQVDFITVLLDITRSPMPCQVGVIFAAIFDQLGRFSIEQYLVWALNSGTKPTIWQMTPQFVVLGRFVAGAVFVGFTRPQTDTFCVATTSSFPVAVVVIALDAVIISLLTVKAFSSAREDKQSDPTRSASIKLVLLGFAIWTATSVTLSLGIRTVELVVRTAVPATGLTILIIIVTGCAGTFASPRGSRSRPPEAPSPRRINISRDISTSDSDYPPSRYEDIKEAAIRSSTTFINPREVPRLKDETSADFPISGMGRIGEDAAQDQFPQRENSLQGSGRARKVERSASQKRSLFGFGASNPTSITVAKVMISNPILQDNDAQNPLNKIATMGLEEAAEAERVRRAKMPADSTPTPNRPITQISMSPEEVLKRGVSVKRKEVASMVSQPGTLPVNLQPKSVASSTASQLSPGVEELRRRSPRQPVQEQMPSLPQPVQLVETVQTLQSRPVSPPSQQSLAPTVFAQVPVSRPDIRPSRQAPPSPKAPAPEPSKAPLQRRPTIGLPSNPRARGMKLSQEQQQQQQTVMFVNNIVYDDPAIVQTIIKGANKRGTKEATGLESPTTATSVVNRPRPIPRKVADPVPQPSPSPHRRSKSGGSVSRSMLMSSAPGSPTQLGELPPLPINSMVGGTSIRPQPNDTKSMTVDEKMTLFFPSPPSGNADRRRSSIPNLPPIPVSYLDMSSSPGESDDHRRSNRTTKTSFKTESILDVDEIPRKKPDPTSRFSPLTELNLGDDIGNSWLPGITGDRDSSRSRGKQLSSENSTKRASSPLIPPPIPARSSAWTDFTDGRTEDDATINWGTVHSPELAVGVSVTRKAVQPPAVQKTDRRVPRETKTSGPTTSQQQPYPQESWLLESESTFRPEQTSPNQWHRRVGDECPTFSARQNSTRSRKVPTPTPLQLNGIVSKNKIVIQAEPSPLESPEHALQEIHAQLKKLEESNRNSLESPSRRLALLENLEKEMGQQEDHWQEMKHDLGRDSLTSVQTMSPNTNRNSRVEIPIQLAREPAARTSIALERRLSRRARMRNSGIVNPGEGSSQGERATSGWQKRLTEAQTEYMEATVDLLRTRNANFLSVSNAQLGNSQLGSPTPPESDQSDEEEEPSMGSRLGAAVARALNNPAPSASLWKPAPKESFTSRNLLWNYVPRAAPQPQVELPGLSVRSKQRKESAPLQIQSSELWRKPYDNANAGPGLWRPSWASAAPPANTRRSSTHGMPESQKASRPLTQKPPRRNKRMTLLPDILESPEPLPDKRGTLGIFQFPWGEKSDTAFVQPSRPAVFKAMPGTMASGGPSLNGGHENRSKQLESAEYSSSFFDDYDDDEDEDQNSDEGEGDESDDGFDETTLWEIASLLNSDAVPSKNSMFPPASNSVVDDYINEMASDDDGDRSSREQSIVIGLAAPRDLFFEQPRQPAVSEPKSRNGRSEAIVIDESSNFWALEDEYETRESAPKPKPAVIGLPANPKASKIPRAAPPAAPAVVQPAALPVPAQPKPSQIPRSASEIKKVRKIAKEISLGLWNPEVKLGKLSSGSGMFALNTDRSDFRTTSEEPAAMIMDRKLHPSEARPLEKLTSTNLWNASAAAKKIEQPWISRASKARSPARRQSRRPEVTHSDWKAALNEAISAGRPKRIAATPAEWDAALQEAIMLSSRPAFDPATRHPVFAAKSLVTRSEWFHPAATGYTYDPASVHPVFFGSLVITCPEEAVHPAMSCYVTKKLRRQRSSLRTRDRPSSRARTLSRSDSSGGTRRKEEIRAQIRVLEQQSEESVPPLPTDITATADAARRAMIMAQIEALEQEKIFVQQAAQQDYNRRTSMSRGMFAPQLTVEPESLNASVLPSAADIIAQQQRRMSQAQMRESMVWSESMAVLAPKTPTRPAAQAETRRAPAPARSAGTSKAMWTPPAKPVPTAKVGLWTPMSSATPGMVAAEGREDSEAWERRARGRRNKQKQARKAEILAQIAAIEAEIDPEAEYKRQKMWSVRSARSQKGNGKGGWLHERTSSRVLLRY